jgi:hypothetical protein
MEKTFSGSLKIDGFAREQVYEKGSSDKSFIPEF